MEAAVSHEGSVTVLRPVGPLIASELDGLAEPLQELIKAWTKRIVINMSEVPFVDSAGLELLCRCQRELNERGLGIKLCGLSEMTQKILELTRLARRFEIHADLSSAVRSYL